MIYQVLCSEKTFKIILLFILKNNPTLTVVTVDENI